MGDEADPPRKFYQLKPKEFEAVNAPVSSASADASPTHVRGHLQAAKEGPVPRHQPPPPPSSDVHALLRDNHARANAAGLNDLAPKPKRRSKRKRDYWLLLIVIDAFFGFIAFGPYAHAVTFVYGLAGMVLFTVGLTWTMWFVMDDY